MTCVELRWQVYGHLVADYGFPLFAAVSKRLRTDIMAPDVDWSMSPIMVKDGRVVGDMLDVRRGTLAIRCPEAAEAFWDLHDADGLGINGEGWLRVSPQPSVHWLRGSSSLCCERVALKVREVKEGHEPTPESYLEAIKRRLAMLDIGCAAVRVGERFTMAVRKNTVIGYAVEIDGLDEQSSITLQESGLGGRRRMGCGFMVPKEVA